MPKVVCEADCKFRLADGCDAEAINIDEDQICTTWEEPDED